MKKIYHYKDRELRRIFFFFFGVWVGGNHLSDNDIVCLSLNVTCLGPLLKTKRMRKWLQVEILLLTIQIWKLGVFKI